MRPSPDGKTVVCVSIDSTEPLREWGGAGDTNTERSADGRFVHFSAAPIAKPRGEYSRRTAVIVDLKQNAVWAREGLLPTFEWTPAPGAF